MTDDIVLREATGEDVKDIVALLADDPLGASRESPDDLAPYLRAFAEIDRDPRHTLIVAVRAGTVVGTAQLTILPGLSRRATTRAQIEGVRVSSAIRGAGLGARLITWCVEHARQRGCGLVQLTSDATREDAHRFYTRLGFEPTHVGFKLTLDRPAPPPDARE
ncbi:GNAT family N-acetyltransferase [Streptomyces sp. URMC 123]|uniref:GNAT family N-acetyltransferase n=1 Tax=Streptomyces sp. URMC 123 TaxID=3423403 RepID=UPI003F1CC876